MTFGSTWIKTAMLRPLWVENKRLPRGQSSSERSVWEAACFGLSAGHPAYGLLIKPLSLVSGLDT
jgi:hypothetical protein